MISLWIHVNFICLQIIMEFMGLFDPIFLYCCESGYSFKLPRHDKDFCTIIKRFTGSVCFLIMGNINIRQIGWYIPISTTLTRYDLDFLWIAGRLLYIVFSERTLNFHPRLSCYQSQHKHIHRSFSGQKRWMRYITIIPLCQKGWFVWK